MIGDIYFDFKLIRTFGEESKPRCCLRD